MSLPSTNPQVVSPCIAKCRLVNNICTGCLRTRDELRDWRAKPVDDRLKLMQQLQGQTRTHSCPNCDGPAYCAMEDGKSASACWCMTVKPVNRETNPLIDSGANNCLCRKCLCGE